MENTKQAERPTLSALAEENIREEGGYDVAAIQAAWARGDYGTLMDHKTGREIRPATAAEALSSYESGEHGVIGIDGRDGDVYVAA